jgi:hypothetical protein
MQVSCLKTIQVSAPCSQCGAWPPVVHMPSSHLELLCESRCPACGAFQRAAAPANARKLVNRWIDGLRTPEVREVV